MLEVLQTYPSQRKSLLYALGAINIADTQLITFDLDNGEIEVDDVIQIVQILLTNENDDQDELQDLPRFTEK